MSRQWPDRISSASDCRQINGITFRKMLTGDIAAGLRLCRLSGWNQLEHDWVLFLRLSPRGCRVAEKHGKVVGTVATLRYQDRFSWLAMVLVDPAERGAGLGTRLLQEGLMLLDNDACVRLDATPLGRPIYKRHGFIEELALSRMTATADAHPIRAGSSHIRRMREEDLPSIFAWDMEAFGADRQALLRQVFRLGPGYAWVSEDRDLQGYCFGRPGYKYQQLGPIVAKNEIIASELVSECLLHQSGMGFAIDTPTICPAWLAQLTSLGFTEERPFARMQRGEHQQTGWYDQVFGIAGPEFG